MAADVSCLVQILNKYKKEAEGEPKAGHLVTRDLLGDCTVLGNKDLDLDLKVPCGWEKRLDLMSGEAFFQHTITTTTTITTDKLQDLNLPPLFPTFTPPPPNLDLKLFPPSSSTSTSSFPHSVCTLDKVKSALERAAKKNPQVKPEASLSPTSSSTTTITTTSTTTNNNKKAAGSEEEEEPRSSVEEGPAMGEPTALMAAGCPSCLSYVLISKGNPSCPRCCSDVPSPAKKKPRIQLDLNSDTMAAPPTADGQL